jgi:hypothetical protein
VCNFSFQKVWLVFSGFLRILSKNGNRYNNAMSTNAIGKGTVNVTVNMPKHLKDEIDKLAERSGIKTGAYVRALLANYANQRATIGQPPVVLPTQSPSKARRPKGSEK